MRTDLSRENFVVRPRDRRGVRFRYWLVIRRSRQCRPIGRADHQVLQEPLGSGVGNSGQYRTGFLATAAEAATSGIPSDADQRSEAMPITVPTIRRGADGVRYKKLLVLISESDYD